MTARPTTPLRVALCALPLLFGACRALPEDQLEPTVETYTWVDDSRTTRAVGGQPEQPERTLETRVWVGPAAGRDAGSRPLLLIAHGLGGHPDKFDGFASSIAEQGYVVAAPTFPVSNRDAGAGLTGILDLDEQPADLRFVLDRLTDASLDPDHPLWRRFAAHRAVALGHSLGGATLLGLARFGDTEPRLLGEAYLAPAVLLTGSFGDGPLPTRRPSLIVHGTRDGTLPIADSRELYEQLDQPRWFLGLEDAGHSDPIEGDTPDGNDAMAAMLRATLAWLQSAVGPDTIPLELELATLADEGHEVLGR